MSNPIKEINFESEMFQTWLELRRRVLREPLGLEYSDLDIQAEKDQHHLCLFDDQETLLGGLVLAKTDQDNTYKMRQVAVDPTHQRHGIGKQLVKFSETFVTQKGATRLVLHARASAVFFYLKLGYEVIGEAFEEIGIPHYRMEKEL